MAFRTVAANSRPCLNAWILNVVWVVGEHEDDDIARQGKKFRAHVRKGFNGVCRWVVNAMTTKAKKFDSSVPPESDATDAPNASSVQESNSVDDTPTPAGEVGDLKELAEEEGGTVTPDL